MVTKPPVPPGTNPEDHYFYQEDMKLIEQLRKEREERIQAEMAKEAQKERDRLRELHWMQCPKCGHEMLERSLENVKVDICTLCEGIFFDRGELEELMLFQQSQTRRGFFRRLLGIKV